MELRDYIRVLRARKRLILLPVILLTVAAVAVSMLQQPVYEGVAQVLVTRQDKATAVAGINQPDSAYEPARDNVQTQVEIIQSVRIADRVIKRLHLGLTADELLQRVSASADTGTNVIRIRARGSSGLGAKKVADAFAKEYVAWSLEGERESIGAAVADVERRMADARKEISRAEQKASSPNASSAARLQLGVATDLYANLADRLEDLKIAEQLATGTGSLLSTAGVEPTPVSPRPARNAVLGLSLGLLVGLGLVFTAEHFDNRIGGAEEAGEIYGAPVLASIPEDSPADGTPGPAAKGWSVGRSAEAYRVLRNNLDFINVDGNVRTLMVTSALPSEGKSTAAANLAAVLAQAGQVVMLVTCDFHKPTTGHFFKLTHATGLSEVLQGRLDVWTAAQRPEGYENLWVLTAGSMPPNPSEILGSMAMGALLGEIRESLDWVILDTTPVLSAADATALVRWADGVLVVVRAQESKRDSARAAREHLSNVGARVLGLIVWGADDDDAGSGFGGYYSYAQTDDAGHEKR